MTDHTKRSYSTESGLGFAPDRYDSVMVDQDIIESGNISSAIQLTDEFYQHVFDNGLSCDPNAGPKTYLKDDGLAIVFQAGVIIVDNQDVTPDAEALIQKAGEEQVTYIKKGGEHDPGDEYAFRKGDMTLFATCALPLIS